MSGLLSSWFASHWMPPAPRHRSFSPWLRVVIGWALPCPVLVVFASVPDGLACLAQAAQVPVPKAAPKAPAQKASRADAALPTARSIIDRHIVAWAVERRFWRARRTHAVGTVSIPSAGMTGSVDVFAAKPDKITAADHARRDRIDRGRVRRQGRLVAVADDRADAGAGEGAGAEALRLRFPRRPPRDDRYESMTTMEKTDFEGRPCYKLRLVRRAGGEEFEFYDVETGLKAGGITTRESPMGPITGTTIETDYKKFGSLRGRRRSSRRPWACSR